MSKFVSFLSLQLLSQINLITTSCFDCTCDDCDYDTNSDCYDPFSDTTEWNRYPYGSLNVSPAFNISPSVDVVPSHVYNCSLTSYDYIDGNKTWRKLIKRGTGAVDAKCLEYERDKEKYKNVICFNCVTVNCNAMRIEETKFCYTCSCENCSNSDKDMNCIKPNEKTQKTVREQSEFCVLLTWEMDYAQKTLIRGIGIDMSNCLAKKNQDAFVNKFSEITCKVCNGDRCNGVDVTSEKKTVCYECECKNCTFQTAMACINPGLDTRVSWPVKDKDFCVLLVARTRDGGVDIERSKQCDFDYCESKFLAFKEHDRVFCFMCNDDRCNGFDRSDVIFQMMRMKQKRNETKCNILEKKSKASLEMADGPDYL